MKEEWTDETLWIEVLEKNLYPPEAITKKKGALQLMEDEDFKGLDVLDHACGTGWLGKLAKDRGANVIGADISETLLATAKKDIDVVQIDDLELPFKNNSFDYMSSFMVLHIVEDVERLLSEYSRVLRHDGPLAFAIVNPHSENWAVDLCYKEEYDGYKAIEKREWVFNLTDGTKFSKTYWHRPLEWYMNKFSKDFLIEKLIEPQLPEKFESDINRGIYARHEYLMGIALNK